jgi:hypothetical protein
MEGVTAMKGLAGFVLIVAVLFGMLAWSLNHALDQHDHVHESGNASVEERALDQRIPMVVGPPQGGDATRVLRAVPRSASGDRELPDNGDE